MTSQTVADSVDERARLRALDALQVLDTPKEERFDRLVEFLKELFDVPVASVNFIDADRLWSKASVGLPVSEMPRLATPCNVTIQQEGPFVVPDLAADERFNTIRPLMDTGLRFYAGEPLHSGDQRVGSLCIMGYEEREVTGSELRMLRALADWVEDELTSEDEMERAALVQRALQPRAVVDVPGLEVAGCCLTARRLGGDFYDWFVARDALHVIAGDVMGKGIGAALIASSVRAVLRGAARFISLDEAFTRTAHDLDQDLGDTSTFVTAFGATVDPRTGRGTYVDAGHGLAVVVDAEGVPRRLRSHGLPMGAVSGDRWAAEELVLAPGDSLVVVSDGVLDLFDSASAALDALTEGRPETLSAQETVDRIVEYARDAHPTDDVTVVVVKRSAG